MAFDWVVTASATGANLCDDHRDVPGDDLEMEGRDFVGFRDRRQDHRMLVVGAGENGFCYKLLVLRPSFRPTIFTVLS